MKRTTWKIPKFKDTYKYYNNDVLWLLIDIMKKRKIHYDVMKINKLMYIIYGMYLSKTGEYLIESRPEIWPSGPVIPAIRDLYVNNNIKKTEDISHDKVLMKIINKILDKFGNLSTKELLYNLNQFSIIAGDLKFGEIIPTIRIYNVFSLYKHL